MAPAPRPRPVPRWHRRRAARRRSSSAGGWRSIRRPLLHLAVALAPLPATLLLARGQALLAFAVVTTMAVAAAVSFVCQHRLAASGRADREAACSHTPSGCSSWSGTTGSRTRQHAVSGNSNGGDAAAGPDQRGLRHPSDQLSSAQSAQASSATPGFRPSRSSRSRSPSAKCRSASSSARRRANSATIGYCPASREPRRRPARPAAGRRWRRVAARRRWRRSRHQAGGRRRQVCPAGRAVRSGRGIGDPG